MVTDTNSYGGLTEEEYMLYLSTIIYSGAFQDRNKKPINLENYPTIGAAVKEWDTSDLPTEDSDGNAMMSKEEWEQVRSSILNNEAFANTTILNIEDNDPLDRSMTVQDGNGNLIIVYRGTAGGEWPDNGVGAYGNVSDTVQQQKALDYYNRMKELYGENAANIFVTGHSKGGNKTMYVTALGEDVTHGYAFDGQGFSSAFMAKYLQEIQNNKDKITNISSQYDYVNILLYSIAGTRYFTDTPLGIDWNNLDADSVSALLKQHSPISLMSVDENGNLALNNYDGIEQDPVMTLLGEFTCYLSDNMDETDFQDIVYQLMLEMTPEDIRKELGLPDPELDIGGILDKMAPYLVDFLHSKGYSGPELVAIFTLLATLLTMLLVSQSVLLSLSGMAIPIVLAANSVAFAASAYVVIAYGSYDAPYVVRDFTEETLQHFLELLEELEESKDWYNPVSWDVWDRIGSLFGQLTPEKYANDMDSYYQKTMDIKGFSKEKIEQIFNKVNELDLNFKNTIETHQNSLSDINIKLKTFHSKFTTG